MPQIGRKVKNFKADATNDRVGAKQLRLSDFTGQKLVLYFYPKDATPGCTRESQDFRDLHKKFRKANTSIIGVSRDSIASHEKFRDKQALPFDLIADTDQALCDYFDVIKEKNMYGRKVMGIERSTFLIDEVGKLRQQWRKVKVADHGQRVLEAAESL